MQKNNKRRGVSQNSARQRKSTWISVLLEATVVI